jgi:amino acid permease
MENASRALLIAASVLVGVMIVSVGVVLFSSFGNSSKDIIAKLEQNKTDEFIAKCVEMSRVGNEQFAILGNTMSLLSESSLGLSGTWANSIADFQNLFNETMDIVVRKGKAGWDSYAQVAAAGFQAVGTLLNNLSNEQDTSSKEGFETQKKMQISATVMNMLSGIMSAWASAMQLGPIAGPIFGAINTAATAALGGVQIAKISQQKFGQKQNGSGSANTSSSAVSNMIMPPVQYSNAVQGASTEGAIKDTKVYVTETDIADTQRKVSVQESENTY